MGTTALDWDGLAALARAAGAEALRPHLHEVAWPSIRLLADWAAAVPEGGSKLGGLPDAPAGFAWPRTADGQPLTLLAQLDLLDLAGHRDVSGLPGCGHLLVFYDMAGGWDDAACHVAYVPAGRPLARLEPPAGAAGLPVAALAFAADTTLPCLDAGPMHEGPPYGAIALAGDADAAYDALLEAYLGRRSADERLHRMFGFPDAIQDGEPLAAEYVAGAPDDRRYRLLLQLDTDGPPDGSGMAFGDRGRLAVWVPREHLRAARFDAAYAVWQCP